MPSANFPPQMNGAAGTALQPSNAKLAMDNLLRRELRVGDPNDPQQVAKALLERYQHQPRARAIKQEAQGLPFLQSLPAAPAAPPVNTATSADLEQAMSDIDKDLEELTRSNQLKDIAPELDGWSDAIRSAATEGASAARTGMDPYARDRAFGIRRSLGDYARMARIVGALTPSSTDEFRSLATSIDEVCAVILVLLGESMANTGLANGRYLLQAPYGELQQRRDACINSLQNLLGSMRYTQSGNDWPRGIDAYRRLFGALEAQGQGDLRALMTEQELSRIMDDLVRRAAEGSTRGLRALGSTAQIELQRVHRLINFGYGLVTPESPPLTSFLEALRLFADGFSIAGGCRLLRISRPAIVFYGLYDSNEEAADQRLTQLTVQRGKLAAQLDCLMRCGCDLCSVSTQLMLDAVLYCVDRAIDLYAVGQDELGLPETRAASYSYLIDVARHTAPKLFDPPTATAGGAPNPELRDLAATLHALSQLLRPQPFEAFATPEDWILDAKSLAAEPAIDVPGWSTTPETFWQRRTTNAKIEGSHEGTYNTADVLHQELCLFEAHDTRFGNIVRQVSSRCVLPEGPFRSGEALPLMIQGAKKLATHGVSHYRENCGIDGPDIPPHFETSLATLATDRNANGVADILE